MVKLNHKTITDALMYCYGGFNRTVGIAFSNHQRMMDFANALHKQYETGGIPAAEYKNGIDKIYFDTGSSVHMFSASAPTNLKGLSYNMIVYDEDVNVFARNELQRCEQLPKIMTVDSQDIEMEVDEKPMNEFLGEFTVMKE